MARSRPPHKADIKARLEKAALTLAHLDAAHGLPAGTCSAALRRPHPKGEAVIADALGEAPSTLWPHRYHPDGRRLAPQPMENYRPGYTGRHVKRNG